MTHPSDEELEAMAELLDRNGPSHVDADIWMSDAAAMLRACKGRAWGLVEIDSQVVSAARDLGESGKQNPKWAFIDYEENQMSFGRWAKCGKNPAPYIRLDLALAALETAPDYSDWDAAIEAAAKVAKHYQSFPQPTSRAARYHEQNMKHTIAATIRALKKGSPHE